MANIWVKIKETGEIGYTYPSLLSDDKRVRIMFPERGFMPNLSEDEPHYEFYFARDFVQFPEDIGRLFDAAFAGVKEAQRNLSRAELVYHRVRLTFQGEI